MRKYKKQELFNCIKTLLDAHKKLDKVNMQTRINILPQCQEMAIQVGTEIERSEGEGTFAVSYLEQYCEELYLASNGCKEKEWVQHQKRIKTLLLQTEKSIRDDISDSPLEIVFLPYKASMWDALDSVYRAAVQEQNCNVIVMPIPYYNISSQGEVLSVEYEGALFPEDIEITDFRECDLGKLHPDVIFIHNPYDEYNRVTQVPQEYFSSSLVNYTEHLVYIPYFVTRGDTIKQDYCIMPGVKNAWRTFVQSEAVRACYIEAGADAGKVVALGSPKFDMVVRMQENPPEIPKEWEEALSGRKIFLLNTHLNPIINDAEKMIDKLHQIFALFAERDDVALLWRPHPLSIQTVKSMNPRMLEAYLDVVETFKKLGNGIYDDSADVHRAIAISDAYIGNWSSLVTMYGITGKPIYILSLEGEHNIRIPEQMKYLQFACGAIADGYLWMPAESFNGLYRMDLEQGNLEFVTTFENENKFTPKAYRKVISYKHKLFFVPKWANNITVYSIETGKQETIHPNYENVVCSSKFEGAVAYDKYIYMFPAGSSKIACLNMETYEIEYISECADRLKDTGIEWHTLYCGETQIQEKTWLTMCDEDCLIEFNLKTHDCFPQLIGKEKVGIFDVAGNEKELYILNRKGELYKQDLEIGRIEMIWRYSGEMSENAFYRMAIAGDYLWLLPYRENIIVKINTTNMKTELIALPDEYMSWEMDGRRAKCIDYVMNKDTLIICPAIANCILYIDLENGNIKEKKLEILGPVRNARFELSIRKDKQKNLFIYYESSCPLEYYMNCIVAEKDENALERKKAFREEQSCIERNCGKVIWRYINENMQ